MKFIFHNKTIRAQNFRFAVRQTVVNIRHSLKNLYLYCFYNINNATGYHVSLPSLNLGVFLTVLLHSFLVLVLKFLMFYFKIKLYIIFILGRHIAFPLFKFFKKDFNY